MQLYGSLGELYRCLGEYEKALSFLEKAHCFNLQEKDDVRLRYVGFRIILYLGNAHFQNHFYAKARSFFEQAYRFFKKYYGADHYRTAAVLASLGKACVALLDFSDAENYLFKAYEILLSYHGEMHSQTAIMLSAIGKLYFEKGSYHEAEHHFQKGLSIKEKLYDPDDVRFMVDLQKLGQIYTFLGKFDEAETCLHKALNLIQGGEENIQYSMVQVNLSNLLLQLGRYEEAREYGMNSFSVLSEHFNDQDNHIEIVKSLENLASIYSHLGDHSKAKDLLEEALTKIKDDSMIEASVMNILGDVYRLLGDYQHAENFLVESIRICLEFRDKSHIDFARMSQNLGQFYYHLAFKPGFYKQGNQLLNQRDLFKKARGIFSDIVVTFKAHYGEEHYKTADKLKDLGYIYYYLSNFKNAELCLTEALPVLKKQYGNDEHPNLVSVFGYLGAALLYQGDYARAKEHLKTAYELTMKFPEEENFMSVMGFLSEKLGDACFFSRKTMEDVQSAVNFYTCFLKFSPSNSNASIHYNLAWCYWLLKNFSLAEDHFKRSISSNPKSSIYCEYGLFLFNQERVEEAVECFNASIRLTEDGSGLSYGVMERFLFDVYLQQEISEEKELEIQPLVLSYYLLVQCYHALGDIGSLDNVLETFKELVNFQNPSPFDELNKRLLGYINAYLSEAVDLFDNDVHFFSPPKSGQESISMGNISFNFREEIFSLIENLRAELSDLPSDSYQLSISRHAEGELQIFCDTLMEGQEYLSSMILSIISANCTQWFESEIVGFLKECEDSLAMLSICGDSELLNEIESALAELFNEEEKYENKSYVCKA